MHTDQIADIVRRCRECGTNYVFTAGEQQYFAQKDLQPPQRCPDCRQRRKLLQRA